MVAILLRLRSHLFFFRCTPLKGDPTSLCFLLPGQFKWLATITRLMRWGTVCRVYMSLTAFMRLVGSTVDAKEVGLPIRSARFGHHAIYDVG